MIQETEREGRGSPEVHSRLNLELRLLWAAWPEWKILEVPPWRPTSLIANAAQGKRPQEQEEGG